MVTLRCPVPALNTSMHFCGQSLIGLRTDAIQLAGLDQRRQAGPVCGSFVTASENRLFFLDGATGRMARSTLLVSSLKRFSPSQWFSALQLLLQGRANGGAAVGGVLPHLIKIAADAGQLHSIRLVSISLLGLVRTMGTNGAGSATTTSCTSLSVRSCTPSA